MKVKTQTLRVNEKLHWLVKILAAKKKIPLQDCTELLLAFALREGK